MPAFYQIGPVQNNAWHARPYAERERIFHTKRRSGKILPRVISALKAPRKYCPRRLPGGAQECTSRFDLRLEGVIEEMTDTTMLGASRPRSTRPSPNLSPA